jgi:hypothetical protein
LNVRGGWRLRHMGTFGLSAIGALGSSALHMLSPLTTTLTYGVFAPDHSVTARLYFDHRVLDGVESALALEGLDQELRGSIVDELRILANRAA